MNTREQHLLRDLRSGDWMNVFNNANSIKGMTGTSIWKELHNKMNIHWGRRRSLHFNGRRISQTVHLCNVSFFRTSGNILSDNCFAFDLMGITLLFGYVQLHFDLFHITAKLLSETMRHFLAAKRYIRCALTTATSFRYWGFTVNTDEKTISSKWCSCEVTFGIVCFEWKIEFFYANISKYIYLQLNDIFRVLFLLSSLLCSL